MDYTLFLGCMIPLRYPQIEAAARASLPALGIGMEDPGGFSCCPEPWSTKGSCLEWWLAVAVRNLAVAEKAGRDTLALCNGCYSTLAEAEHIVSGDGPSSKKAVAGLKALGLSYTGKKKVRHIASVLADIGPDKVSASVKKPLKGIKVAVHHGCHLLRPAGIMGFDDPFNPVVLEGLTEALGAEVVLYDGYTDCCGKATRDREASLRMGEEKVAAMETAGADCIAVVCPACFEQFDLGQVEMKRTLKKEHGLPVFHYCQLLAIAQGRDPDKLGVRRHHVDVKSALSRIGKK